MQVTVRAAKDRLAPRGVPLGLDLGHQFGQLLLIGQVHVGGDAGNRAEHDRQLSLGPANGVDVLQCPAGGRRGGLGFVDRGRQAVGPLGVVDEDVDQRCRIVGLGLAGQNLSRRGRRRFQIVLGQPFHADQADRPGLAGGQQLVERLAIRVDLQVAQRHGGRLPHGQTHFFVERQVRQRIGQRHHPPHAGQSHGQEATAVVRRGRRDQRAQRGEIARRLEVARGGRVEQRVECGRACRRVIFLAAGQLEAGKPDRRHSPDCRSPR